MKRFLRELRRRFFPQPRDEELEDFLVLYRVTVGRVTDKQINVLLELIGGNASDSRRGSDRRASNGLSQDR